MNDPGQNIRALVYDCFKEITSHALQGQVLSPHIKKINHNLENILNHLDTIDLNTTSRKHHGEKIAIRGNKRNNLLKVAYAMSRFDYHIVNDILKSHLNQNGAFEYLAKKLDIKLTTLRNYRDAYDPYVAQENSNRRGWHQKELSHEYQLVKDEYDIKDYTLIKHEIEEILKEPKIQY